MLIPKSGIKPTRLGATGQTCVLRQSDRSCPIAGPVRATPVRLVD
jgi:hypothetical protein